MAMIKRKRLSTFCDLGLYTDQEFLRIHEYEKLRSDRNGMKFSLIIVNVDINAVRSRALKGLLTGILGQLRIIDHIGWFGPNQIGLILPGTDEQGALGFLKNIDSLLGQFTGVAVDEIQTYPLPNTLMTAVSASSPIVEAPESVEAEEVVIIPFDVGK